MLKEGLKEGIMEYILDFSERLIEAAESFIGKPTPADETGRIVIYLSLLSCEISIKSLLETAQFSIIEITKMGHRFPELTKALCLCDLKYDPADLKKSRSAADLLGQVIDPAFADATVGTLLSGEERGASKYPNEIRYGDSLKHFHPMLMLQCAKTVLQWARENIDGIHQSPPDSWRYVP